MADINPTLLAAIIKKTGLQRAQVYVRIKQTASNELLPRHLAAIRVAADVGLTINKYAPPMNSRNCGVRAHQLLHHPPLRSRRLVVLIQRKNVEPQSKVDRRLQIPYS